MLIKMADKVDTLPLDEYSGLRWTPKMDQLAFLHRPLRQDPPAETELWLVHPLGSDFRLTAHLAADKEWALTKRHVGDWMLLESADSSGKTALSLADGQSELRELRVDSEWTLIPGQGDGIYFQDLENDLPFEQFVDVEEAPETKPTPGADPTPGEEPVSEVPTRTGLKIASYDTEQRGLVPLLTIPFSRPEEEPKVTMTRRSPDLRFLAMVIQFGKQGKPGLWIYDGEAKRLLWTRVMIDQGVMGIDWSSDSTRVAVSDSTGVSILESALGITSERLQVSSPDGLRPKWGAGNKLYLLNNHQIYLVDEDQGQANPVFDTSSSYGGEADLIFDPMSSVAAYSVVPQGSRQLVIRDIGTNQEPIEVTYPGSLKQKAQGSVVYQVGSALRYSWFRWTGR